MREAGSGKREAEEPGSPLTTAQTRLVVRQQRDRVDQIMVQAASSDQVDAAATEITSILEA
ncbi:MAG: hypothetical protein ACXU9S_12605, partial [Gemmatimonadaceae bacterium]